MTVQGISAQTEMVKRIQARPAWQSLLTVLIASGMRKANKMFTHFLFLYFFGLRHI
jgi:hypothetical protein